MEQGLQDGPSAPQTPRSLWPPRLRPMKSRDIDLDLSPGITLSGFPGQRPGRISYAV